jgi:hypothetical protein
MRMMRWLLHVNFIVAAWLSVAWNLIQFGYYILHFPALRPAFGPFMARITLAPLGIAFVQLFLWFRFYRFGGFLARFGAACAGGVFAAIVFVQLLRESIGTEPDASMKWLYSYLAASHLAYACFARRLERPDA